jgi:tetratricopeptide (TPR) repeat protein
LREAADVLMVLDWVTDQWKWQWISESLKRIVQAVFVYDPAHLLLGQAYLNLGDYDQAEAVWRQAKGLPNACQELDLNLFNLRMKRVEKAIQSEDWQRVVQLLDGQCNMTPRELLLLGDAFLHLGAPDRARGTWEAAKRDDPGLEGVEERLRVA